MKLSEPSQPSRAPILVIDDDTDIRETLVQILEFEGYPVIYANNGHRALELLADESQPRPRLILLDLMMPIMDGYEFRKRQLSHPKLAEIPVIVLSADGSMQLKAKAAGLTRCMKKPIELEDLLAEIRRYY